MKVLLLSMIVYLLGIAVVLYIRPAIMFNKDGSWKEFGVGSDEVTVLPFWLFCIVWAVTTYGIGRIFFSATVAVAATAATAATNLVQPLQEEKPETKPGYYKLNSTLMKKKGIPRYIYVGPDPPSDLEDD